MFDLTTVQFLRHAAMPGPMLFFSTLMGDEAKSIARGLQKRDPDLLDRLSSSTNTSVPLSRLRHRKQERAEDFSKRLGSAFSSVPPVRRQIEI